jgi:hypothetical protein
LPTAHTTQPGCLQHLISIGVEGLSAGLPRGLAGDDLAGAYANFRRFGYEGVTTFSARSDYTRTIKLVNRIIQSTGRPVLRPAGQPTAVRFFDTYH